MSDSFANLWSASSGTATASQSKPQTLAAQANIRVSASNSSLSSSGKQFDAFSLLAASGSKHPTPSSTPQPKPMSRSASKGADAFSDLLSTKPSASAAPKSMATLQSGSSRNTNPPVPAPSKPVADIWDFDVLASKALAVPARPNPSLFTAFDEEDTLLGDFSKPAGHRAPEPSLETPTSSFDDNLLGDLSRPVEEFTRRTPTPSFTSQAPGVTDEHEEDDVLGLLGRPAQESNHRPSNSTPPSRSPVHRSSVSPPPHIIGQIVEMGFTPDQARIALASTDTGLDVQAALETLLANAQTFEERPASPASPIDEEPPRRKPVRQPPPDRSRRPVEPETSASGSSTPNLQEHADRLIAQATQLGLGVFGRANALWSQSVEKVQKAYEERAQVQARPSDGRPKWMQDAELDSQDAEARQSGSGLGGATSGGFKDDDDDVVPAPPFHVPQPPRPRPAESALEPPAQRVPYKSPFRHGKPKPSPANSGPPSRTRTPQPPFLQSVAPVQPQLQPHQYASVTAPPPRMDTAARYKAAGNASFKLGAYGDAETAFSQAIDALPSTHLLLVPLYTNRALARIRNGNPKGCAEDASAALAIIGEDYTPGSHLPVTFVDVKLDDAYLKALRRRAEGYEALEKWDLARTDWIKLSGTSWAPAHTRGEATTGVGRCRKMVAPPPKPDSQSISKPKPKPPPTRPQSDLAALSEQPSELVNRLREANMEQEAEEAQKHSLKDVVDARIMAWGGGKTNNLRALIANLDTVLWPELNWRKVGMAELVSEKQVKVQYTKAISKVHPDKLSTMNVSVEDKMIANSVFATLNEAWVNFKP